VRVVGGSKVFRRVDAQECDRGQKEGGPERGEGLGQGRGVAKGVTTSAWGCEGLESQELGIQRGGEGAKNVKF